jgi:hypothetical protein
LLTNYILINQVPVIEPDWDMYTKWLESHSIIVGQQVFTPYVAVSTIFISSTNQEVVNPLHFETLILSEGIIKYRERYRTWKQAVDGHAWTVMFAKRLLAKSSDPLRITGKMFKRRADYSEEPLTEDIRAPDRVLRRQTDCMSIAYLL